MFFTFRLAVEGIWASLWWLDYGAEDLAFDGLTEDLAMLVIVLAWL